MLDSLLRPAEPFGMNFMRIEKRMFHFENVPDENLVSYIQRESFKRESIRTWVWSR